MKKLSQYLNYLILLSIAIYAIVYFLNSNRDSKGETAEASHAQDPVEVDRVVNKFMKQTADQTLRDQVATQMAIKKQMTKSIVIEKPLKEKEEKNEDMPAEKQIWRADRSESPSEQIRLDLYNRDLQKQMDEQEKKEYARQYIENARQAGYHLELSKDLKVIRVTPIRKPSQDEDIFETSPED